MTIKVGEIIYNRGNWQRHRDAIAAVQQRLPEALFDTDGKLWKFANVDDLLTNLARLAKAGWPASGKPGNAGLKCLTPKPGQRAGTVIVQNQTFESIDALRAGLPAIGYLTEHRDLISSPEFEALARDDIAQRWDFPGWDQVGSALAQWKPGQPYPKELLTYRIPKTPEGGGYDLGKLSKMDIQSMFANCGDAASHLIGRVHHAGGQVELWAKEEELTGQEGTERLRELLTTTHDVPVLINVTTPVLHEFLVELRPDGQAVLQQGYQGAYDALWWAGQPGGKSSLTGEDHQTMEAMRDSWGKGQPVDLAGLGQLLCEFMTVPSLHDAGTVWRKLPFLPSEKLNDDGAPAWRVQVWLVRAPAQAVGRLTDEETPWVTTAVLQEADRGTRQ